MLLGPALPCLCVVLPSMGWQFGAGCSAGLPWGLQGGCPSCPSPVIIREGMCPCLGGDIPLPGRDVSPRALPRLQCCASPSLGNRFSALGRG